jgi:hypothetical protein
MLKVVVANERTKTGPWTKNGERERRATRTTEEGKLATKGPDKGKRKEGGTGKDPVRRKMTSNNRKMTFRQQKTTKLGPN